MHSFNSIHHTSTLTLGCLLKAQHVNQLSSSASLNVCTGWNLEVGGKTYLCQLQHIILLSTISSDLLILPYLWSSTPNWFNLFQTIFMDSFIHSFIPSFIHSSIHSFIHSSIHSFIHSFPLYSIKKHNLQIKKYAFILLFFSITTVQIYCFGVSHLSMLIYMYFSHVQRPLPFYCIVKIKQW